MLGTANLPMAQIHDAAVSLNAFAESDNTLN